MFRRVRVNLQYHDLGRELRVRLGQHTDEDMEKKKRNRVVQVKTENTLTHTAHCTRDQTQYTM